MASDVLEIGHQQVWYWLCVYEQRKKWYVELTHWGWVICISKLTIIGSGKCLSPGWCQAIIWTSAGRLLIGPLGTNFSESLIEIHTFPCKKMHLKISFAKWCLFCPCPNVLTMMLRCNNVLCTWQLGGHVVSIWVKSQNPGVSATYWTVNHLVPDGLLVYWTMTDLVPAGLTQVSSDR